MTSFFLTSFKLLLLLGGLLLGAVGTLAADGAQIAAASIIKTLADDQWKGRAPSTKGSNQALTYLENWLVQEGLTPAGKKSGSFRQPFEGGTNLVAIWHPTDTPQAAPVVLISAHFDHLAQGCSPHVSANSSVCNGATDNAAGVAAALLAATQLRDTQSLPFALLLSDGEESNLNGSRAFVSKPSIDLSQLALVINLDIVGLNLFKGLENHHLIFGLANAPAPLQQALHQRLNEFSELKLHHFSYGLSHGRSDHTSFMTAAKPYPSLLLSDGSGGQYHSTADEWSRVNLAKVVAVAKLTATIAIAAANASANHGNSYSADMVNRSPSFPDTQALLELLNDVLEQPKANGLYGVQLARLRKQMASLKRIEKAGEAAFGQPQAEQIGSIALEFLQLSRESFFQNATSDKE